MALDTIRTILQMPIKIYLILIVLKYHMIYSSAEQRPFYNIAHMVNSIKEVDDYLRRGANAIETDVTFSPNGSAVFTFHGYPCDCLRHCTEKEEFPKFLEYIRDITTPGKTNYKKQLTLLFLDLKISQLHHSAKAVSGQELATSIVEHLFNESVVASRVKVLLSVGHIFDYDFILGFENELVSRNLDHLNNLIGWDVGLNDPLFVIESMWKRMDMIKNIWQGDGRTNCLSPFYNLGRLSAAIKRRDDQNMMRPQTYIDKVYHWTIDLTVNLRSSLRTGVDGIITNHPERLVNVLREKEFVKKFRLATQSDNPWERFRSRKDDSLSISAAISQPIGFRIVHGIGDMFTSFTRYVGDFAYLRNPFRFGIRGKSFSEEPHIIKMLVNVIQNINSKSKPLDKNLSNK